MAITTSHAAPSDLSRLLKVADAPDELRQWARARADAGVGADALWEECDKGDWLMWLAAVELVPMVTLVVAAAGCAEAVARSMPKGRKRLLAAVEAARQVASIDACTAAADACENKADSPERANYRVAPPSAYRWAASSAAYAARAAEGLLRAEVVRATQRDTLGRERAASIGAGEHIMNTGAQEPLRFAMDDEWVQYSFHAALRSVGHAVRALLPAAPTSEDVERVEAELSEVMFAVLDPVRTGLRSNEGASGLVRRIEVSPYKASADASGALADLKRPRDGVFAAFVVPIGGGHHFAEHGGTGTILSLGIVGSFVLAMITQTGFAAPVIMMLSDALLAPAAVRRRNEGRIYSKPVQWTIGALLVVGALLLSLVFGR